MQSTQVSTIVLPSAINIALLHGVDINKILQKLGISIDLGDITRSTIDITLLHGIVREIETISGIQALPLEIGKGFAFEYSPIFK